VRLVRQIVDGLVITFMVASCRIGEANLTWFSARIPTVAPIAKEDKSKSVAANAKANAIPSEYANTSATALAADVASRDLRICAEVTDSLRRRTRFIRYIIGAT